MKTGMEEGGGTKCIRKKGEVEWKERKKALRRWGRQREKEGEKEMEVCR